MKKQTFSTSSIVQANIVNPLCVCICIFNCVSGLISRAEAEELLGDDAEVGAYLVRLSDKVFGYTISYKDEDRIKHFLIDASKTKKVKFDGSAEKTHKDLAALVEYHQVPINNQENKEENAIFRRHR